MYTKLERCRICGNKNLKTIIDLGEQVLTGRFPKSVTEEITKGPLTLVKCEENGTERCCGLLQPGETYNLDEMYGENYGYRSGLNSSMIDHLNEIVNYVKKGITIKKEDYIIDVGSNDSTLLQCYGENYKNLIGIDPTGSKFESFYPEWITLIPHFFPCRELNTILKSNKAKVITSICMFYDLENPVSFAREITNILADDGIWVMEQSYYPLMLETNSFDTICHEHLEFYGLKQIMWIAEDVGLKVIDAQLNNSNGGSFLIKLAKKESKYKISPNVDEIYKKEIIQYNDFKIFDDFKERIEENKEKLLNFIFQKKQENKRLLGYGASTKGNVLLQYYGISSNELEAIVEINPDKFGCYTPKTKIPIISDKEIQDNIPDYLIILPWHFRDIFLQKERKLLEKGCKFVFPLPSFEIVSISDIKE